MLYKTQQIPALVKEAQKAKWSKDYLAYEFSNQTSLYQQAILVTVYRLAYPYTPSIPTTHPAYSLSTKMIEEMGKRKQIQNVDEKNHKFHKPYHPDAKMSQDYDVVPPADWVHHERKLENEALGKTYHPPKMVGAKAARRGVKTDFVSPAQVLLAIKY
jgi:hypothetical protein